MNQFKTNYKTLIPAVVAAGIVLYEAISGHAVDKHVQDAIVNDGIAVIGFGFSVWGIIKNHKKGVTK